MPNQQQVLSAVRWLIAFVGGIAVGKGWITSEQLVMITAAAISLVPLIWSFFVHKQSNAVATAAKIVPVPVASQEAVGITKPVTATGPAATAARDISNPYQGSPVYPNNPPRGSMEN